MIFWMEVQILIITGGSIAVCIIMRRVIEHIKDVLDNDRRMMELSKQFLEETKELLKNSYEKGKQSGTKA